MSKNLMAQTCAGYVILKPLYGTSVEIQFQEPGTLQQRSKAREWLLDEGFLDLAAQTIKLEPEVTQYLENL